MIIYLILSAFLAGLFVSIPAGPAGILCIRNNLLKRGRSGIATGVGAAFADFIYAGLAIFGIGIVFRFLQIHKDFLYFFGGIMILTIGTNNIININENKITHLQKKINLKKDFLSGFFVTIVNPLTLISFFAIFALLGIGRHLGGIYSVIVLMSVFFGSVCAWLGLNYLIIKIKKKRKEITLKELEIINKISGLLLLTIGILLLLKSFL